MENLIGNIIGSFIKQGVIGWIIIFIILILAILSYKFSNISKNSYENLLDSFNNALEIEKSIGEHKNLTLKVFKQDILKNIDEEFKKSAQLGKDNINTEAIIQKNLDREILGKEALAMVIPTSCIALGLIGTFLGLTTAIMSTTRALSLGAQSMVDFAKNMEAPLSSMSSAFWTSVFGMLSSLVLNLANVKMKGSKEKFYDVFESYLDNKVFALYAKNFNSEFCEFNKIIRESMISLTDEMKDLFKYGVDELVKGINKNNLDLTKTVEGLSNYTKDLDRLTNSLNISIENFKNPVDVFKTSIYEFISISDDLMYRNKENIGKFCDKLERIDNNLSYLYQGIDLNSEELKNVSALLKNQDKILECSYDRLIDVTDSLKNIYEGNKNDLHLQIQNLNSSYITFKEGMNDFTSSLDIIQKEISNGISKSFKIGMDNVADNIVKKLDKSLIDLKKSTEQLNTNSLIVGQLVKATNEWVALTKESAIGVQ